MDENYLVFLRSLVNFLRENKTELVDESGVIKGIPAQIIWLYLKHNRSFLADIDTIKKGLAEDLEGFIEEFKSHWRIALVDPDGGGLSKLLEPGLTYLPDNICFRIPSSFSIRSRSRLGKLMLDLKIFNSRSEIILAKIQLNTRSINAFRT